MVRGAGASSFCASTALVLLVLITHRSMYTLKTAKKNLSIEIFSLMYLSLLMLGTFQHQSYLQQKNQEHVLYYQVIDYQASESYAGVNRKFFVYQ